jgi:hypothetical protein
VSAHHAALAPVLRRACDQKLVRAPYTGAAVVGS